MNYCQTCHEEISELDYHFYGEFCAACVEATIDAALADEKTACDLCHKETSPATSQNGYCDACLDKAYDLEEAALAHYFAHFER